MAACASMAPIDFALAALAASLSDAPLLAVEAAASVAPAMSSMNWTWIFLFVKQTLIRGRSLVPRTFLRIRQCRNFASLCFCSVRIFLFLSLPVPLRLRLLIHARAARVTYPLTARSFLPSARHAHPH